MRRIALVIVLALAVPVLPMGGIVTASAQVPETPLAAARETEPVVLTGTTFPEWAAPADATAEAPHINGKQCEGSRLDDDRPPFWSSDECTHNEYEEADVSTQAVANQQGTPTDQLLGYRWTGEEFEQIPFQVDEMAQRYLSNNNSGFSFYSETDPHHTYAFDREGFRWTGEDPENPCVAQPESEVAPDPVPGLDTDDELVFMARDTGAAAPADAELPPGIEDSYQVAVTDPVNGNVTYAYVMKAAADGPTAAFDASNGYVRYERDADANVFLYSESSYDGYGAAEEGPWFDPETGICHSAQSEWRQHRPGDQATISTPRYRFRYEGRWLMTELRVSSEENGNWEYREDLIDQWKARAFQQRPSGETPCCGFEEEVNNWGGSSILMGERSGPVRTIRETWGADSGTNVVRREIFYRDEIRFGTFLRVHVIPPLDGIYAQWDYNAGKVSTYYNQFNPDGVAIDGKNDEQFGNSRIQVSPEGASYCGEDRLSEAAGAGCETPVNPTGMAEGCAKPDNAFEDYWDEYIVDNDPTEQIPDDPTGACIYNDIDSPDPTFSGVNAGLNWEEVAGPNGTLVMRTGIKQFTPGGTAQSLAAVPYYRDDACFDDGTGSNPGPHVDGRSVDDGEDARYDSDGDGVRDADRRCWDTDTDPVPPVNGDPQYFQGSIGTHGVHILVIGDSDNAGTTLPLTEIDSEQRMVVLPGEQGNVGEAYGRHTEKPLVAVAVPESRTQSEGEPEPAQTQIEITGATSGQITDTVTLAARLTSGSEPVAGKEIAFTLRGQVVGTATTDADGVASVDVTLEPPAEETDLIASFAGDEQHAGSSATSRFTIQLEDSSMSLTIERSGSGYTATATLTEADTAAGLQGRTVRFTLNGTEVATDVTDADGVASATLSRSQAKKNDLVRAVFDGDASYSAASAEQRVPQN